MSTKINLSALKNNTKTEQNIENIKEIEQKTSPPQINNNIEEKEEKKSTRVITVSLGKKKNSSENKENINIGKKIDENKTSKLENNIKKYKENNPKNKENINILKKINEDEISKLENNIKKDKENNPENKTNISILKKIDEDKNSKLENNIKKYKENINLNSDLENTPYIENGKKDEDEIETIFTNYESDFITEEKTLFQKIKELKNLPKTRPQLIIGMIAFLVIGTSVLVYIAPENSTLKADILNGNKTKITKQIPKHSPPSKKIKKIENTKPENKLKDFLLKKHKTKKKNINHIKNFFKNKKQNNIQNLKDFFKKNKVK